MKNPLLILSLEALASMARAPFGDLATYAGVANYHLATLRHYGVTLPRGVRTRRAVLIGAGWRV